MARVKQTYSILQQGFRRAVDEYGDVASWCTISSASDYAACTQTIFNNLSSTTQMSQCKVNACFARGQVYRNRSGENNISVAANHTQYSIAVLNNGTSIAIKSQNGDVFTDWWVV